MAVLVPAVARGQDDWPVIGVGNWTLPLSSDVGARGAHDVAVVVGFQDYNPGLPAVFAKNDADLFVSFLRDVIGLESANIHVAMVPSTVPGESAIQRINEAVDAASRQINKKGGRLWFYYAGHAMQREVEGSNTPDVLFIRPHSRPTEARVEAYTLNDVRTAWRGTAATHAIYVIDGCGLRASEGKRTEPDPKRAISWPANPPPQASLPEIIWLAGDTGQTAGSSKLLEHGLFTYFVVGALTGWAGNRMDHQRTPLSMATAHGWVSDAVKASLCPDPQKKGGFLREQTPQVYYEGFPVDSMQGGLRPPSKGSPPGTRDGPGDQFSIVSLDPDRDKKWHYRGPETLEFVRPDCPRATVEIWSEKPGATIELDGRRLTETTNWVGPLPIGQHTVVLRFGDSEFESQCTVLPDVSEPQWCPPKPEEPDKRPEPVAPMEPEPRSRPEEEPPAPPPHGTPIEWVQINGDRLVRGKTALEDRIVGEYDIPPFEVTRSEISVHQYGECVDEKPCVAPGTAVGCNWAHRGARANHPVNCVTLAGARDFAQRMGGRLLRDVEYEYLAGSLQYPWGGQRPDHTRANFRDSGCDEDDKIRAQTVEVCTTTGGRSRHGLCDLAGNVSEWIDEAYLPAPSRPRLGWEGWNRSDNSPRVVRGGSFCSPPEHLESSYRSARPFDYTGPDLGFRVVRPVQPPTTSRR